MVPPLEPALHAPDGQVGAAEVSSSVGLGGLRRGVITPRSLGIESKPHVHDARPGALRGLVVGGDAAVDEHLTGEVAVVSWPRRTRRQGTPYFTYGPTVVTT